MNSQHFITYCISDYDVTFLSKFIAMDDDLFQDSFQLGSQVRTWKSGFFCFIDYLQVLVAVDRIEQNHAVNKGVHGHNANQDQNEFDNNVGDETLAALLGPNISRILNKENKGSENNKKRRSSVRLKRPVSVDNNILNLPSKLSEETSLPSAKLNIDVRSEY